MMMILPQSNRVFSSSTCCRRERTFSSSRTIRCSTVANWSSYLSIFLILRMLSKSFKKCFTISKNVLINPLTMGFDFWTSCFFFMVISTHLLVSDLNYGCGMSRKRNEGGRDAGVILWCRVVFAMKLKIIGLTGCVPDVDLKKRCFFKNAEILVDTFSGFPRYGNGIG